MKPNEAAFEEYVATWLAEHGGYDHLKGPGQARPLAFDPVTGIDTEDLFEFIGATQSDAWERLKQLRGGLPGAQSKFVARLAAEIDKRGTLDVLRHGVVDHGVTIRLAYFRPAHGLTPELVRVYGANRLNVTRQLAYQAGSTKTIDLGLFVNGLLVATAELKNALTGPVEPVFAAAPVGSQLDSAAMPALAPEERAHRLGDYLCSRPGVAPDRRRGGTAARRSATECHAGRCSRVRTRAWSRWRGWTWSTASVWWRSRRLRRWCWPRSCAAIGGCTGSAGFGRGIWET